MAKKVIGQIKLQIPGGAASPAPPVGPALGQAGLNIMDFCKAFNARTEKDRGLIIPLGPRLGKQVPQVKQALAEIDSLLAKGGSDKTKILSAVIWLADIADFAAMNAVWDAWAVRGQAPARATVEARLNDPNMKVEIMVVAAL